MSDIAGAAAPVTDAPLSPVMQSFGEAASNRMASLKSDPAWGQKYLAGDVTARNEMKTLLHLVHEQRGEADQAALAQSIKLERVPSLVTAERQRAEAEEKAAAFRPALGEFGRALGVEQSAATHEDLASWASGLSLAPTIARTVLQRVADEGQRVAKMSADERSAWHQRQSDLLLGAAYGDKAKVDAWRAAAAKVVAGSRYDFSNAFTLNDAFIVRALALAGASK
jgi:hypothetical protein